MKEYELWLDESGEFKNDREEIKKINYNPSLMVCSPSRGQ